MNGVVGKRCKFNLFISDSTNLNLEIDIRGEQGDSCSERIKREGLEGVRPGDHRGNSATRVVGGTDPHSGKDAKSIRSMWAAFSRKSLFGTLARGTTRRALVRQTSVVTADQRADRKTRIPLDYQALGDNHLLISYIPRSAGAHRISIRWHGEPIPGSPFSAQVAQSVDTLVTYRSRTFQKQAPKEVAFKEQTEEDGDNDAESGRRSSEDGAKSPTGFERKGSLEVGVIMGKESAEPAPVQAAILSHTSTVHRSLSCSSSSLGGSQSLTKQATITRRRVLRRVIARAGQEIVIHEVPPTASPSCQEQGVKTRMGSPSPKSGYTFDFMSDSEQTSRSVTPQPDTEPNTTSETTSPREEADFANNDSSQMKKARHIGREKEKGLKSSSRPGLTYRRYNSDSSLSMSTSMGGSLQDENESTAGPIKPIAQKLLSVPIHDDNFKSSPFHPTNPWNCDNLAGANIKEKLLEGGFITQMSLSQSRPERIESDSTLDSDSDVVSQRDKERPTDSDSFVETGFRVIAHTNEHIRGATGVNLNERGANYDYSKVSRSSGKKGLSSDTSMSQDSTDEGSNDLKWQFSSDRAMIDRGSCASRDKRPVSKTSSDPSTLIKQKRLLTQRSNTNPVADVRTLSRQRSVDQSSSSHGSDSPSLVLLQSDSLRKSCFYISQKAITDSIGGLESQGSCSLQSEKDNDQSRPAKEKETHTEEIVKKATGQGNQSGTGKSTQQNAPNEPQKLSKTGVVSSQTFRQKSHRSLGASLSLPTLSKQWRAFELEPDAKIDSIDEIAVVDALKNRHKRATLGSCELAGQLQDFNKLVGGPVSSLKEENITSILLKEEPSKDLPSQEAIINSNSDPKSSVQPLSMDVVSHAYLNMTKQIQRGALQRQGVHQYSSSSDSMTTLRTQSNEHESSDKENETPISLLLSTLTPDSKRTVRSAVKQTDTLSPSVCKAANRFNTQHASVIKIPKVKVDRTTQVSYCEIKAETGWVRPSAHMRRKKKAVKKHQPLSEQVHNASGNRAQQAGKGFNKLKGASKDFNKLKEASKEFLLNLGLESDSGLNSSSGSNSELLSRTPSRAGQQAFLVPGPCPAPASRPVRQSTVDTVDSGIANEPALFKAAGTDTNWSPARQTPMTSPSIDVTTTRR